MPGLQKLKRVECGKSIDVSDVIRVASIGRLYCTGKVESLMTQQCRHYCVKKLKVFIAKSRHFLLFRAKRIPT